MSFYMTRSELFSQKDWTVKIDPSQCDRNLDPREGIPLSPTNVQYSDEATTVFQNA